MQLQLPGTKHTTIILPNKNTNARHWSTPRLDTIIKTRRRFNVLVARRGRALCQRRETDGADERTSLQISCERRDTMESFRTPREQACRRRAMPFHFPDRNGHAQLRCRIALACPHSNGKLPPAELLPGTLRRRLEREMSVGGSFWDLLKPNAQHEGPGYLRGRRQLISRQEI